jgi:hypothetical protein
MCRVAEFECCAVWMRVMMMRELIYSLQWLLLKELSCEEGSFSICQKINQMNKIKKMK